MEKLPNAQNQPLATIPKGLLTDKGFKALILHHEANFVFDEDNKTVIRALYNYYIGNPDFETNGRSLKKGIILFGNPGTGKTKLMDIINQAFILTRKEAKFHKMIAWQITKKYRDEKDEVFDKLYRGHMFFDEIGRDKEVFNDYGFPVNTTEELIMRRYNFFLHGIYTHFTTNLSMKELEEHYDERTISRLRHMCNFICLTGKDRRLSHPGYSMEQKYDSYEMVELSEEEKKNRDKIIDQIYAKYPKLKTLNPSEDEILKSQEYKTMRENYLRNQQIDHQNQSFPQNKNDKNENEIANEKENEIENGENDIVQ